MEYKLFGQLQKVLQKDERLVAEGELLRNKIVELARKNDTTLLKHLLADKEVKSAFFVDIDGVQVFDSERFVRFVNNKDFLPDSYTVFKKKIGLAVGDEFIAENKNVVLNWPYKDCILEGGQTKEDAKRDEVFWNETLAPDQIDRLLDPKVFTNWKRIDAKGEHKLDKLKIDEKGDIKDNLIIKGNNLLALHSLKARFAGKVKLIYIDPPYYFKNDKAGDSFSYNSNFKLSTWLVFMKNRLEAAKKLLSKDGVIFVQINEDSHSYLKALMDEVFLESNFINTLVVKVKNMAGVAGGGEEVSLRDLSEKILAYTNDINQFTGYKNIEFWDEVDGEEILGLNVIYDLGSVLKSKTADGKLISIRKNVKIKKISEVMKIDGISIAKILNKYSGRVYKETFKNQSSIRQLVLDNSKPEDELVEVIYTPKTGQFKDKEISVYYRGNIKRFVGSIDHKIKIEGEKYFYKKSFGNIWDDISWNGIGGEGGVNLNNGKKPEKLLARIIEMTTEKGDIVLDYHLGSGTTAAVAHKMGRQFFGIEQLDYDQNDSVVRLKNVVDGDPTGISEVAEWKGGGDFVYAELISLNEVYVDKVNKSKTDKELKKVWDEINEKGFLSYKIDLKKFNEKVKDFNDLSLVDQKRFILESLDYNQLYVNYSEMGDKDYAVKSEDKKLNKEFYGN